MARRIKVLHIITRLDWGGSATNTLETVRRLDPGRFEVHLIAGRTQDLTGEAKTFIARYRIQAVFCDPLVRDIHPFADLRAFRELTARIRHGRYDIVHTHSSKAGILGRWAARVAGAGHIVHTPHGHVFYGYFSRLLTGIFIMAERLTEPITDRLIELTPRGVEQHLGLGIGTKAKWVAIPSGIDLSVFQPSPDGRARIRRAYGIADTDTVFMSLGRLEPVKGNRILVEAFCDSGLPNTRLMVVGDGRERGMLEAVARDKGLPEQVLFTGRQKDAAAFLNAADVVVMPSLNEGMGRTAVEAMACGKPVIASAVGGLVDVLRHEREGLLVPSGDVPALAAALRRVHGDPALREALSTAALVRAAGGFSIETMVSKIECLYEELINNKNG